MKEKIYVVELYGGNISLDSAKSLKQAERDAKYNEGANNVSSVRLATDEEIDWVRAMGGYVPDLQRINA